MMETENHFKLIGISKAKTHIINTNEITSWHSSWSDKKNKINFEEKKNENYREFREEFRSFPVFSRCFLRSKF